MVQGYSDCKHKDLQAKNETPLYRFDQDSNVNILQFIYVRRCLLKHKINICLEVSGITSPIPKVHGEEHKVRTCCPPHEPHESKRISQIISCSVSYKCCWSFNVFV